MLSFQKDSRTWRNFEVIIWKCQLSLNNILGMSGTENYWLSLKPLAYTPCEMPFGIGFISACAVGLCKAYSSMVWLLEASDYLEL